MSRRRPRPSPTESATDFPLHYERVGGDGAYWHVAEDKRGVKRWKKGMYTGVHTGKEDDLSLSSETESLKKALTYEETM